jgi:hypothetical protein
MGISPKNFYNMTLPEFWAAWEVYCDVQGINQQAPPMSKTELLTYKDKYG